MKQLIVFSNENYNSINDNKDSNLIFIFFFFFFKHLNFYLPRIGYLLLLLPCLISDSLSAHIMHFYSYFSSVFSGLTRSNLLLLSASQAPSSSLEMSTLSSKNISLLTSRSITLFDHVKHYDLIRRLLFVTAYINLTISVSFSLIRLTLHYNYIVCEINKCFCTLLSKSLSLCNEYHSKCLKNRPYH